MLLLCSDNGEARRPQTILDPREDGSEEFALLVFEGALPLRAEHHDRAKKETATKPRAKRVNCVIRRYSQHASEEIA